MATPMPNPAAHSTPIQITVAMLGARRHYAVPRLLHEAGLLGRFYTDLYVGNKPWLRHIGDFLPRDLAGGNLMRALGRVEDKLPASKVHSFDSLGIRYAFARRRAANYGDIQLAYRKVSEQFARRIGACGFGTSSAVWGFNNASLELFRLARSAGLKCVLEQTILPARLQLELMREEARRWPGWQSEGAVPESDFATEQRAQAEWSLADVIVAGSQFVADGLVKCGVPVSKVRVVPYGVDVDRFPDSERLGGPKGSPLRVLFAGEVGLRKGVPDLLEALRSLGPRKVRARLAGRVTLDPSLLEPYRDVADFLGAVPRPRMQDLYRWADVFVLPSIVEGSAAVTYEALLSGLPVVTTPNSGSLVAHDQNGYLVPIRRPDQIADALDCYWSQPGKLDEHRDGVRQTRQEASFERYGVNLKALACSLNGV